MRYQTVPGRINVKALVILGLVFIVLAGGFAGGYKIRKRIIANRALAAGTAAFDRQDWPEAAKQLRLYLSKFPEESPETLDRYATACLSIRPKAPANTLAAVAAYRKLSRLTPDDERVWRELARLYLQVGNHNEAAHACERRLQAETGDQQIRLLFARSLIGQRKFPEAAGQLKEVIEKEPGTPEAYVLLAAIAQADESPAAQETVLGAIPAMAGVAATKPADLAERILALGIEKNPSSALLLARRAQFMRLFHEDMAAARRDLEAADALKPSDPSILLFLLEEWLAQPGDGQARAETELRLLEGLDDATLAEYDTDKQEVALPRFRAAVYLERRKGDPKQAVVITEQALAELTGDSRLAFLPTAVESYLADGLLDKARQAVDEYRRAVSEKVGASEALRDQLAVVESTLATVENRHGDVIDRLGPLVAAKPDNRAAWLMLTQAYRQAGRRQQMVSALETCIGRWPKDPEFASRLADAYQAEGRFNDALKYATVAEQGSPADLARTLTRMRLKVNVWLTEGANPSTGNELLTGLAELRRKHPRSVDIRVLQAAIGIRQGHLDSVITDLETAPTECDRPFAAELMLVQCYDRKGLTDKAVEAIKGAVQREGDVAGPRLALAELYARSGRKEEARSVLEEARAALAGEEKVGAARALAQYFLVQGERPKGIELLQQLATERPQDRDVRLSLLQIPEVLSDTSRSQKLIEELKNLGGERPFQWQLEQARLLLNTSSQGTPEEARKKTAEHEKEIADHLYACIEGDPAWVRPVVMLGAVYEMIGKDDLAEQTYRKYLQTKSGHAEVSEKLVGLLLRQRRFTAAAEILRQVPERILRDVPDLKRQAATVAIGTGNTASAIRDVETLVANDPKDAGARVTLSRLVYADGRNARRALQLLDEAEAIQPDSFSAISTRAEIHHAEGRDKEALEVLNAAVARREDFASYLLRAQFHNAMKEYELAEADYVRLTKMKDTAAAGYELLGAFHESRGDSDKAIATWEAGLKEAPGTVGLEKRLVKAMLGSPKAETRSRGRAMLDDLLTRTPADIELLSLRTELRATDVEPVAMVEKLQEEEKLLEQVVQANPGNVDAHLRLVALARAQWDPAKASERLGRALEANSGDSRLIMTRAEFEAESGNEVVARELARSVLSRDPKNLPAYALLTAIALRAGQLDTAISLNDEALKAAPGNEVLRVTRAQILDARGQRPEAIQYLKAFCESEQGRASVAAQAMLADLYRANGDFTAAQARIDKCESLAPGDPGVFVGRVALLVSKKELDAVSSLLADFRTKNPDQPAVLLMAAGVLARSGDQQAGRMARGVVDELVVAFPNFTEGHIARAETALRTGELEIAVASYRNALNIEPFHQRASNDLAWVLGEEMGKPQEALEIADKAAARYPNDPHLLDTRGAILIRLEKWPEARRDLERCVELAVNIPSTRAHASIRLAKVLQKLGDSLGAKARLDQVLQIDQRHKVLSEAQRSEVAKLTGS